MSNSELDSVVRTLSSNKSSGNVEISAFFVKRAPILTTTPGLLYYFNKSLLEGEFLVFVPIFKKVSVYSARSYRPISLLFFLSCCRK